jgi:hypothetical protein
MVPIQAVNHLQVNPISCSVNRTPMPLIYQTLLLAKVALLLMASQCVIIVVAQSPAQVMSMVMV